MQMNDQELAETVPDYTVEASGPNAVIPERFHVHDEVSANWVVRQIAERRAYAKRCVEWCEREQARAKHEEDFFLYRFGEQLKGYVRQTLAEQGGRRKSVALPGGTIGFRSVPSHLVVMNEEAVISWAKAHKPDLVKTTEAISRSGLSDHFHATGEMPDTGVQIEPAREKFFVK